MTGSTMGGRQNMRDMESVAAGLGRILAEQASARQVVSIECQPLTGGYSRVMTRATVTWEGGSREDLILRGDPDGSVIVYDTNRLVEWNLLRQLTSIGSIQMPPALYYDDGTHLGTKTIVLGCCPGPSLQSITCSEGADLPKLAEEVVDAMVAVHRTELDALAPALVPPASWDAYLADLSSQWARAERSHPESMPVLRYLSAWLAAHRPPAMAFTLVHGDFQPSNILVHSGLQVIDWEYAHIGDPREDLGWFNLYSASSGAPNLYGLDPEAFLDRYRSATGATPAQVNQATAGYFSVLAATRVYLDILRSAGSMAVGTAHGVMLTYSLNACALGNANWLNTCRALEGQL
jgi:aminoglycoside phosphotransferase (APT) family kinase protein